MRFTHISVPDTSPTSPIPECPTHYCLLYISHTNSYTYLHPFRDTLNAGLQHREYAIHLFSMQTAYCSGCNEPVHLRAVHNITVQQHIFNVVRTFSFIRSCRRHLQQHQDEQDFCDPPLKVLLTLITSWRLKRGHRLLAEGISKRVALFLASLWSTTNLDPVNTNIETHKYFSV